MLYLVTKETWTTPEEGLGIVLKGRGIIDSNEVIGSPSFFSKQKVRFPKKFNILHKNVN
jgi:hypothetical protein